jgi:hypothetical protein
MMSQVVTRADAFACLDVLEHDADSTLREHLLGGLRGFLHNC